MFVLLAWKYEDTIHFHVQTLLSLMQDNRELLSSNTESKLNKHVLFVSESNWECWSFAKAYFNQYDTIFQNYVSTENRG